MSEQGRRKYCTECGSIVNAGDRFCGVCGAGIRADAPDASPPGEVPTIVQPPPQPPRRRRGNRARLALGAAGILVVLLVVAPAVVDGLYTKRR